MALSENLKGCSFILVQPKDKRPYVEKGQDWNNHLISFDEANSALEQGFNIGLVCGNGVMAIDCDHVDLINTLVELFPDKKTYVETTTSGGYHVLFKTTDVLANVSINFNGQHMGEIRVERQYIVVSPSKAVNKQGKMGTYELKLDYPLNHVSKKDIDLLLSKFNQSSENKTSSKLNPELREVIDSDSEIKKLFEGDISEFGDDRSNAEMKLVNLLVKKGLDKSQVFSVMAHSKTNKWSESHARYRALTYQKAVQVITKPEPVIQRRNFNVRTYRDFEKIKKDKNFLIENFLYPKTTTMIHSPPGSFKSIIALGVSMALATGKPFMNMKSKKTPVLYLDGENADSVIGERLKNLRSGLKISSKNFPLYIIKNFILMDEKKNVSEQNINELNLVVNKNKIKLIVIDTLHRFCFYDENKSDDINKLYIQVFKPLIEDYGVSILFLHHSTKPNKGVPTYRGSSDFMGLVDVSYRISRVGKTSIFRIINEKCRSGEVADIKGEITFDDDYIKILRIVEKESSDEDFKSKQSKISDLIKTFMPLGKPVRRKTIIEYFEMTDDVDTPEGSSLSKSVDRSLIFLQGQGWVKKDVSNKTWVRIK